jgi:probable F420-dependent oxidoreductase
MYDVKFGLMPLPVDMADAQVVAQRAEAQGYYSLSHNDHFYSPLGGPDSPQLECLTVMTVMGMATKTIKIAPSVIAASFRTPPMLAKIATSIDLATNGRFICGLGAGWYDKEYEAHGYPFPPLKQRLEQLEETVQVLKAMWTEEEPAFGGEHFNVHHAYNNPRPTQKSGPPIMLGGSGTGILKMAARHADILNMIPPTGNGKDFIQDTSASLNFDMAKMKDCIAKLHQFCREIDRDPAEIELGGVSFVALSTDADDPALREVASSLGFPDYASAQRAPVALFGTPDEVKQELARRIEETGLTYFILAMASPESQDLFAEEVMPALLAR